ncbi:MAG: dihydrolipoamide acetyltransferase family protein [Planctomycetota bacterium]|jgi:pyruvate/2-oxoglutarate dehydrogenase complex dihydrolipoamide acyltransferase (E2) component
MTSDFKLPDLGEGVHEGQIVKLFVNEGDPIAEDQPLMEVETDKAAVEIPSPFTGTIEKWHVAEQQVVNVGDVMVTVATDAAARPLSPPGSGAAVEGASKHAARVRASAQTDSPLTQTLSQGERASSRRTPASPAVRKLARTLGIDLGSINGSGQGGRVTRADVEAAAAGGTTTAPSPTAPAPVIDVPPRTAPAAPPPPLPAPTELPAGTDDTDHWGAIRRAPISQTRRTIAKNMVQSWTTVPHVTDSNDADVTELDRLRRGYPAPENQHRTVTMLAFVVRAVARALRIFPEVNAHFDAGTGEIVYKRYVSIAIGVHTDRGLITPVIRDADTLGITQIADALAAVAERARTASFDVNDTRGGTYTISNAGAAGPTRYSTPIIPPGQCAVLAVGRTRSMPWVVDGQVTPRLIMPLSHSFDHRLIDGAQEVAFIQQVIGALENPARMLL